MRIALLTNDNREIQRKYHLDEPVFGPAPEALLEGFKLLDDEVEVHVVSCLQQMPRRSPKKLANNIFYHPLHVPKIGWLRTGYQGCIRATRRAIHGLQPDIVHGQGTERDCAMCAVFSGLPNILTIHGVMRAIYQVNKSRPFSYYWFAKHLETVAVRRTRGVIAISPYVQGLASRMNRTTWLIPNALRLPFFRPSPPTGRRPGPPRLINVGTISSNKRQLELLQHLKPLRDSFEFDVTFVGKSDENNIYSRDFASLLQTLNARYGSFLHYEHRTPAQIAEMLDDSDAMLHFSLEESFGLIFAEALVRNLSLFASDVGAIRQIGEGIPNCNIISSNNFTGLVNSVRSWLVHAEYKTPRASTPSQIVYSRYFPEIIATQHLEVYRQIAPPTY